MTGCVEEEAARNEKPEVTSGWYPDEEAALCAGATEP